MNLRLRCAVGRGGRRAKRREGDGITPAGRFAIRQVLYRPDKLRRPRTALPVTAISPGDGWCDKPADRNYNRPVELPYPASHERLWRDDALYDLIVVLGFNDMPRSRGRGSAIFLHLATADYRATAGCIALARADMLRLLTHLSPGDTILIP